MNNWIQIGISILVVLGIATYIGIMVWRKEWRKLRETAYKFMLLAEKNFAGSEQGKEKLEYVFQCAFRALPFWMKFFITEDRLKVQLQKWYNHTKDFLDDGKINNSVKKEAYPPKKSRKASKKGE